MKIINTLFLTTLVSMNVEALSPRNDDLILGQSGAFKGESSELGTDLWKGANAYFTYINAKGGVNGKKIRVLPKDDGFEGKQSLVNTIDFVKYKHVFALFNYLGTQAIQESLPAVQKFYAKENVFLFSNFTGAKFQRENPYSSFVFNIRASYEEETAGLVEHFIKIGKKRFALFIQYDAYGRAGAAGVRESLKQKGLEVVAQSNYIRGAHFSQSMRKEVLTLLKAKADVIITIGSYAASAAFIRDARNAGYGGPIADVSGVGPDSLLELLKEEEKKTGRSYTQKLVNSSVVPPPSDTSYPLVREYLEVMQKYATSFPGDHQDNPKSLSFTTLEGFLNAKVFVAILKRVKGVVTRKSFYQTAKKIQSLDIGLGKDKIDFTNSASQGLNVVYFVTIKDGHYSTITDWNNFK